LLNTDSENISRRIFSASFPSFDNTDKKSTNHKETRQRRAHTKYRRSLQRGMHPRQRHEFFSSLPPPDRVWGQPSLLSNGYQGNFLRG